MNQDRINQLLKLYADNISTREEVEELFALMEHDEADEQLKQMVACTMEDAEPIVELSPENWAKIWNNIRPLATPTSKKEILILFLKRHVAAAALILMAATVFCFMIYKKKEGTIVAENKRHYQNELKPGGNKAVLTLANGTNIILDTAQNGYLVNQSNTKIIKLNNGLLKYKKSVNTDGTVLYNTITTPRGGQYQVELPDGTIVWLNAESSLQFPTSFTGKERKVELKGEGYFEVAKNADMPFIVTAGKMDVHVLGTHFNIMNYADEDNTNATLLEGNINLTTNGVTKNLKPGHQAVVSRSTNSLAISAANVKQVMAWKNGEFRFKETGIKEIMRQVSRWYNVDVEYQTNNDNQYFTASLPRMQDVSALLQMLELTGTVHFKIAFKKIIVLP